MKKIASFTVNHNILQPGVYVSRVDGDAVTYDLRMKKPNAGSYITPKSLHTIEHLLATYVRNSSYTDQVIYAGPMGCRTGFQLIIAGELEPMDIIDLLCEMYAFMAGFEGEVPGADAISCGNYLDMNLPMAKYAARKYLDEVLYDITEDRLNYPD